MENAYKKGQEDKIKTITDKAKTAFAERLLLAQSISEGMQDVCKKNYDIAFKRMFLKPESERTFETLIVVSEKNYISDDFNDVYSQAAQIKQLYNNPDFHINFVFTSITSARDINNAAVLAGGYILEYGKKNSSNAASRPA
ncbi:MAG: hypothetical protein QM743_04725 [Chitinophagaceae bacterium]